MSIAAVLADVILLLHFSYIVFVVGGLLLIFAGGWLGWSWVRNRLFRWSHLIAIGIVTMEAWLGWMCPLTIWEDALRRAAGQPGYQRSFLYDWIGRIMYFDAPPIVFAIAYTLFGLIVLVSWRLVPPRRPAVSLTSMPPRR